ncbi:unnamed protein product [Phytophthora lilii]|uniref:Unnamed protein product n=1 Tax=Phytophthora lilii TaxID=2077276 RepID=A0A9W6UCA0_9STRA|nr:unnamed protein product [Phytophthora lilii]
MDQLHTLETSGVFGSGNQVAIRKLDHVFWRLSRQHVAVVPTMKDNGAGTFDKTLSTRRAALTVRSKKIIKQGLQLLFHCEYIGLVEYVECIIPLVFLIYRSSMTLLPNVDY